VRVRSGQTLAWHDHRLAPPPASRPGVAGRFTIPVEVDGKAAAIGGTFVRVARPAPWPWALIGIAVAAAIWAAARQRPWRPALTVGLGVAGGLAALVAVTTFAVRAAPGGGVAWLQLVSGLVVAARCRCSGTAWSSRRCRGPGRGSPVRSRSCAGPRPRR
jgi:peptidoglycan/LPS O-acetylase OafA/YrhL